ncbi:hypothetical protein KKB44_03935 [Candidatus Micrarchaeota archaeon]|nr:hypothetical protein [Candidatus Micrarchaeota archaeon]
MNVDIKSTVENKLLSRKEIEAEVSYEGATPSRVDIKQSICGKIGANPDLVVLREINTFFGKQMAKIVAHSYENADALANTEPEHIQKRYKVGKEAPKEEPKAEAKEEKKEEPKAEAKKEAPKEEKKEAPKEEPKKE